MKTQIGTQSSVIAALLWTLTLGLLTSPASAEDSIQPRPSGKSCRFSLAWGHTWNVKEYAKKNRGKDFIIQGCSVGDSGYGALTDLGVYQAGGNGDWFQWADNEFGNGGFHLLQTWHTSGPKVISRNNLSGFMRLTQFHTIGMLLEAEKKVQSGECSKVDIQFVCTAKEDDLTQREFDRRVKTAFKLTATEPEALPETDPNFFANERQRLLHRAAQYCGKDLVCLKSAGPSSFIQQCEKTLTVSPQERITSECRKCYEFLDRYPFDPAFQAEISKGIHPAVVEELRKENQEIKRQVGEGN